MKIFDHTLYFSEDLHYPHPLEIYSNRFQRNPVKSRTNTQKTSKQRLETYLENWLSDFKKGIDKH